jgi:DNA repair protein RadC
MCRDPVCCSLQLVWCTGKRQRFTRIRGAWQKSRHLPCTCREFVCAYRPLRDAERHVVSLPTLVLNNPETAARALTPLLAQEPVEGFAIACLSARKRLLAWHLCSRGTRTGTQVSMPDVFVLAVLTPGTTGLIVLHNPPSGEPSPSVDDMAITRRLQLSAVILGLDLHDHLIAGEGRQYFSLR